MSLNYEISDCVNYFLRLYDLGAFKLLFLSFEGIVENVKLNDFLIKKGFNLKSI